MKQIAGVDGAFEQQTIMNKFLMQSGGFSI